MKKRSEARERVYDFLVEYIQDHGYSPTLDEICAGLELASKSTVHYHLMKLRYQHRISFRKGKARTITIREKKNE